MACDLFGCYLAIEWVIVADWYFAGLAFVEMVFGKPFLCIPRCSYCLHCPNVDISLSCLRRWSGDLVAGA